MLLTKGEAEKLLGVLQKDGSFPEIRTQLQENIDGYQTGLDRVIKKVHCAHDFGQDPSAKMVDRVCLMFRADTNLTLEERIEFTKRVAYRCPKCGLDYKYKDLSEATLRSCYDKEFRIMIGVNNFGEYEAFEKAENLKSK